MFDSTFKEGIEQKATFPEDNIDAWALLVQWIYQEENTPLSIVFLKLRGPIEEHKAHKQLIEAFLLAEKYLVDRLADEVMDTIFGFWRHDDYEVNNERTVDVYERTEPGSKLRLLCARDNAWSLWFTKDETYSASEVAKAVKQQPDLAIDMLPIIHELTLRDGAHRTRYQDRYPKCDYHKHSSEVACPYGDMVMLVRND